MLGVLIWKTNKLVQRRRWTFGVSTRPVISDLRGPILSIFETNKVAVSATSRLQGNFIARQSEPVSGTAAVTLPPCWLPLNYKFYARMGKVKIETRDLKRNFNPNFNYDFFPKLQSNFAEISISPQGGLDKDFTYSFIRGAGLRYPVLVVGDDTEVVGGEGTEVLVADGVVLHGSASRPDFRLPFVQI